MKYLKNSDHPYFPLLTVWRAGLALLAAYAVMGEVFDIMLMEMGGIVGLALAGEFVYKGKVSLDNERHRQQLNQELQERRAEESRLRQEAASAQPVAMEQGAAASLDDAGTKQHVEAPGGSVGAMSAEQIETALMEDEILRKFARK